MDVYHFSEQPYPDAWRDDLDSFRVTIPNRLCGMGLRLWGIAADTKTDTNFGAP